MSAHREHLIGVLADRLAGDPILREQVGPIEKLDWRDKPPLGIEADIGQRTLAIDSEKIVIKHKTFGSKLTIPLS